MLVSRYSHALSGESTNSEVSGNLDQAMQQYLELWFPKEVKEKEKLNHAEAAKEELQAMGLDHKCIVQ